MGASEAVVLLEHPRSAMQVRKDGSPDRVVGTVIGGRGSGSPGFPHQGPQILLVK